MIVWRLTGFVALDGAGGLLASARWHTRGRRIIYTAATPTGALVEVLAGLDLESGEVPAGYRLLGIDINDETEIEDVLPATLPNGWKDDRRVTRATGDRWLVDGQHALLRVPSAIIDQTVNVLVNPKLVGTDDLRVVYDEPFAFDARLL